MANTFAPELKTVEDRVEELIEIIRALRPDLEVTLAPRSAPVLGGAPPIRNDSADSDLQRVVFYSRGRAIESSGRGASRPSLISTHPLFDRIAQSAGTR
jgi:hypothetical protein